MTAAVNAAVVTGVSNDFIQEVLNKYCSDFEGVYSCDNIPTERLIKLKKYSIVCNLSPTNHPGSHFVSIIVHKRGRVTYCDPLNLPYQINPDITNFLAMASRGASVAWKSERNRRGRRQFRDAIKLFPARAVQHTRSNFCGFFAMAYVLYFDSNVSGKPEDGLQFEAVREGSPVNVNEESCVQHIISMIAATNQLK